MLASYYTNGPFGQADPEAGLPPGTTGRDVYLRLISGRRASAGFGRSRLHGTLGEYLADKYEQFLKGGKSALYKDDLVTCVKDKANNPVCRLIVEDSDAKRRAGRVAAMQSAADAVLNKVPLFQDLGVEVPTAAGPVSASALAQRMIMLGGTTKNPIGTRAGYDGKIGPSSSGLTYLALDVGSHLNPEAVTGGVAASLNLLSEAALVRFAADNTEFLRNIAANFEALLGRYKKSPPPSPLLVPDTIPIIRIARERAGLIATTVPKKKKFATGAVVGTSMAVAGLIGLAAWGATKKKAAGSILPEGVF